MSVNDNKNTGGKHAAKGLCTVFLDDDLHAIEFRRLNFIKMGTNYDDQSNEGF